MEAAYYPDSLDIQARTGLEVSLDDADEPWIKHIRCRTNDGDVVTLWWDEAVDLITLLVANEHRTVVHLDIDDVRSLQIRDSGPHVTAEIRYSCGQSQKLLIVDMQPHFYCRLGQDTYYR